MFMVEPLVRIAPDENDIKRFERVSDPLKLGDKVIRCDLVTRRLRTEIEQHTVGIEPFERELVNRC